MPTPKASGYRILPLRDHNDMIINAKFAIPDFKDTDKLMTRVKVNLLYYQTNYFLFFVIWPYVFGYLLPDYFVYGMGAVLVLPITLLVLSADNVRPSAIAPQSIALCIGAIWAALCFATNLLTSVMYFIVVIGVPISVALIHATCVVQEDRMQNIDYWKSPMGAIIVAISLFDDKVGLASSLADSFFQSVTDRFNFKADLEKVKNKKGNKEGDSSAGSTPAGEKKKSNILSGLVGVAKKKKSLSGGSAKDMGIVLDKPVPSPQPPAPQPPQQEPVNLNKWETIEDIPMEAESIAKPNKPKRNKMSIFSRKKSSEKTEENKGKNRRRKFSSGTSQKSSASEDQEWADAAPVTAPVAVPLAAHVAAPLTAPVKAPLTAPVPAVPEPEPADEQFALPSQAELEKFTSMEQLD